MKSSSSPVSSSSVKEELKAPATDEFDSIVDDLKGRLWQAFQQNDIGMALRAYQATRLDYQQWIFEEEEQARKQKELYFQKKQEKLETKPILVQKLGSIALKRSRRRYDSSLGKKHTTTNKSSSPTTTTTVETAPSLLDDKEPILQKHLNPSLPFSGKEAHTDTANSGETTTPRRKWKRRAPRFSFHPRRHRMSSELQHPESTEEQDAAVISTIMDEHSTTALHEAARLGSGFLVRLMLEHSEGDPTVRNGKLRTALHMVAGGVLCNNTESSIVGIGAPSSPKSTNDTSAHAQESSRRRRKFSKSLRRSKKHISTDSTTKESSILSKSSTPQPTCDELEEEEDRMDATLAILSWYHPETGTSPSINAVDCMGRTALHYAAELGRIQVCKTLLSCFGCMLTIVDDMANTPCELAASQSHLGLAAQLEARALLFLDPYGIDDELYQSNASTANSNGESNNAGALARPSVMPFGWFETCHVEDIKEERQRRVDSTLRQMQETLQERLDIKELALANMAERADNEQEQEPPNSGDKAEAVDEDSVDKKPCAVEASDSATDRVATEDMEASTTPAPAASLSNTETDTEPNDTDDLVTIISKTAAAAVTKLSSNQAAPTGEDVKAVAAKGATKVKSWVGDLKAAVAATLAPKTSQDDAEVQSLLSLTRMQEAHVERYLKFHEWNVDAAMNAFRGSPVEAFQDASVPLPLQVKETPCNSSVACLICCEEFETSDAKWRNLGGCEHGFCVDCLGGYLTECAQSKSTGLMVDCPHHDCQAPLSSVELKTLSSESMYSRLLEASCDQFVQSSKDLKFCPYPRCGRVVRRLVPGYVKASERIDTDFVSYCGAVCTTADREVDAGVPVTYEGVPDVNYTDSRSSTQPRRAHRFCFICGETRYHWPVTCERLEEWKKKIADEIGEEEEEDGDFNDVAQKLWMKANTRPCPKCKAPIEKNEGCNHMTCTNPHCKHEFCWICRKDWKLHNTATGGFFRCNIWQDEEESELYDTKPSTDTPSPVSPFADGDGSMGLFDNSESQSFGTAVHSAHVAYRKSRDMARFLHHYRRWNAHSESAALERKMGDNVCVRMAPVVEAAIDYNGDPDFNFDEKGLSFIHAAFVELSECRSMLQHSYVFSFFRYPRRTSLRRFNRARDRQREKAVFEQFQSDLEMITEQMSDIVARAHIRATQAQVSFLTSEASEKRTEFSNLMLTLLSDEKKEAKEDAARAELERRQGRNGLHSSPLRRHSLPSPFDILSGRLLNPENPFRRMTAGNGNDALQQSVRATLQQFLAHAEPRLHDSDSDSDGDLQWTSWPCGACTYMNAGGGSQCAMCGTHRVTRQHGRTIPRGLVNDL